MHVGQIFKADIANGVGVRVSVFVSGCTNHCPGCFQPETWDFQYGQLYDQKMEDGIMEELSHDYYEGLSILGGEPFEPSNQAGLIYLIRRVKKEITHKTILMNNSFGDADLLPGGKRYTDVTDEILDTIDILVDGRFEEDKKNIRLKFRGSENQRVIDMKKTRSEKKVELYACD